MRTSIRLAVTALAAGLLLSGFVATASASRFSVSNQTIRAVWRELAFAAKAEQLQQPGEIRCAVTMEGSFHSSTIVKATEPLIGYINRAIVGHPCVGGEYYFHNGTEAVLGNPANSLPWHIRYSTFTGTLPRPMTFVVNITGMRMTVNYGLNSCLEVYGSATETRRWVFTLEGNGGVTRLEPISTHLIVGGLANLMCPELGRLTGASGPVTVPGAATVVSVRLI